MIMMVLGLHELRCDVCGDGPLPFLYFADAVKHKKDCGWTSVEFRSGEWEDVCPECTEEEGI